ncbi:MAG: BatA domain-containing protein [Herpetosiphonaceae bacterium]|nr:BatA domain-containing protein [Herpetosiphonaceae bacterium]
MSLLAPWALSLALIAPAIIALYLLKLRREERTVSSTLLWQRVLRDVEANAPWQKLRRNILLLLQLLVLFALVFALARPFIHTTGIAGRNLILIIDRSASMGATDAGGTRLAAAKAEALRLIDQLPDNGRATVIAIGGQMEVPASASTDRRELRMVINRLQLRNGGGSDLTQALALAGALAARDDQSEVAIVSDGEVQLPDKAELAAEVHFSMIGTRSDNAAISALVLEPTVGGQRLFAQATNYDTHSAKRRLIVELDDQLFSAYDLALDPGGDRSIVADVPATVRVASAHFATHDALPADDQAWAASPGTDKALVRVLSDGNRFLQVGLGSLPGLQVSMVPTTTTTFTETAALTVLDGVVPDPLPPGNLLFIGPLRGSPLFSVTGELRFPAPRPAPGGDPVLQNVGVADVHVLRAAQIPKPVWARTVIDSDGGPLLLVGEQGGRRIGVMSFALHESDLPVQIAFPLLLSNLVSYLAPAQGSAAAQTTPGQPLVIDVPPDASTVRLTPPSGPAVNLQPQNGQVIWTDTEALGIYAVEIERKGAPPLRRAVAVNMRDPTESQIAPRRQLPLFQKGGRAVGGTEERVGRTELWRWLAGLALLMLTIEWLVYQRPALLWLRGRLRRRAISG